MTHFRIQWCLSAQLVFHLSTMTACLIFRVKILAWFVNAVGCFVFPILIWMHSVLRLSSFRWLNNTVHFLRLRHGLAECPSCLNGSDCPRQWFPPRLRVHDAIECSNLIKPAYLLIRAVRYAHRSLTKEHCIKNATVLSACRGEAVPSPLSSGWLRRCCVARWAGIPLHTPRKRKRTATSGGRCRCRC